MVHSAVVWTHHVLWHLILVTPSCSVTHRTRVKYRTPGNIMFPFTSFPVAHRVEWHILQLYSSSWHFVLFKASQSLKHRTPSYTVSTSWLFYASSTNTLAYSDERRESSDVVDLTSDFVPQQTVLAALHESHCPCRHVYHDHNCCTHLDINKAEGKVSLNRDQYCPTVLSRCVGILTQLWLCHALSTFVKLICPP